MTSLSERFNHETRGLSGTMVKDTSNDFTLSDGIVLQIDSQNVRDNYYRFGEKWRTENYPSAFTYFNGSLHSNFVNKNFTPSFMSDSIIFYDQNLKLQANKICGGDKNCLFYMSVTGATLITWILKLIE